MDEKSVMRERIFQAAVNRMRHYGYGKTTMAEIAADCGMSPGNIYRFFEAKIDLAEGMARKHYAEEHAAVAQVARRKDLPPDKRLRELLLKRMRNAYKIFEENAKILEVVEVLNKERPVFINELVALERVTIAAVIEEGMEAGVFGPGDPGHLAEMLQAATARFAIPQLFPKLTLSKLERDLEGVMDLVLNGLYARSLAAVAAETLATNVDA